MKDFFNLYGEGHDDQLKDLERKGEEYFVQKENEKIQIQGDIPLKQPEYEQPDIEINQAIFDEAKLEKEEELPTAKPSFTASGYITADDIKNNTFRDAAPEQPVDDAITVEELQAEPPAEEEKAEPVEDDDAPIDLLPIPQHEQEEQTEEFDDSDVDMKVVKKAQKKALKKARRKKRRLFNLIWVLIILLASVLLAWLAIEVGIDMLGLSVNNQRKAYSFSIEQGATANDIVDTLHENNIVDYPFAFKLYCKLKHADGTFKFGRYTMYDTYNYSTVIEMLQSDGAQRDTVQIVIPECATVSEIRDLLVKNQVCTAEQFDSVLASDTFDNDFPFLKDIPDTVYSRFEGYLYPDTYEFFCAGETHSIYDYGTSNAESAVEKMLQSFQDHLPENYEEQIKSLSKYGIDSLHDVLTLASIVDLECNGKYDQMSSVAAVFMNRLVWPDEPHFLGSTPTYYYPDNRYNTNAGGMTVETEDGTVSYKAGFEGLPPGAQCSPVKQAIEAVLNPNKQFLGQGYYFFVTDTDANYYYNQTLTQHNNTINDLINKGKWDA